MKMLRNHLAEETSPYLLQHADNPVEWYPWGEAALARAQRENKPILLSIGYSACHWCHVMAHESFEDDSTAALMNELFVNIKVDREERPDLDKIYQVAQQMMTQGSGGWPLTMFLTPQDQQPFFGGTYFPKEPRHGMPAFREICSSAWPSITATTARKSRRRARSFRPRSPRSCRSRIRPAAARCIAAGCRRARRLRSRSMPTFGGFIRRAEISASEQHRALSASVDANRGRRPARP